MPTLFLMRHAQAAGSGPDGTDHSRPLTDRGRRDAAAMAAHIAAAGPIDAVVASDAVCTGQTAAEVVAATAATEFRLDPRLYNAPVAVWHDVVVDFDPAWQRVVAVGHNPAVAELINRLSTSVAVPPGTVATIELDSWDTLDGGSLTLVDTP